MPDARCTLRSARCSLQQTRCIRPSTCYTHIYFTLLYIQSSKLFFCLLHLAVVAAAAVVFVIHINFISSHFFVAFVFVFFFLFVRNFLWVATLLLIFMCCSIGRESSKKKKSHTVGLHSRRGAARGRVPVLQLGICLIDVAEEIEAL